MKKVHNVEEGYLYVNKLQHLVTSSVTTDIEKIEDSNWEVLPIKEAKLLEEKWNKELEDLQLENP